MPAEKIDAVIVGAGLAGLAAAYRLAEAGKQVLVLERGDAPGSRNVTGGRIYAEPVRAYFPTIVGEAPFERHVVKEMITVLDDAGSVHLEYAHEGWRRQPYMSYIVLRARFDQWFSEKVMEQGGFVIPNRRVDDLLWEDGRVAGVRAGGEEIWARLVIAADVALSFMAQKAYLRGPLEPANCALAINLYALTEETGEIAVEYAGCLECGTCKIACAYGSVSWEYPRGEYGVQYRYG